MDWQANMAGPQIHSLRYLDDGLPLSLLEGGLGLLSLGGVGLLSVGGGLLLSVLGGGFVGGGGGVDCVGHFAEASITDPSGHVFVVCVFGCCGHDGSEGFALQSTVGGCSCGSNCVPLDPPPFPVGPADLPAIVMLDGFVMFVGVGLVTLMGIVAFARLVVLFLAITVNVADLEAGL
jgi:hypothetical protein